jgi:hypothetical protein
LKKTVLLEVSMSSPHRPQVVDSPLTKERRSWNRVPIRLAVFCRNNEGEDELYWSAQVVDISCGGMQLLSRRKFEPTTLIRIGKAEDSGISSEFLEAVVIRVHESAREEWTLGCALIQELTEAELLAWIEKNC